MEKQDFDPKTFFAMHDLNGDGVLDDQEVEAILQLEAKKMYMSDPQHPGDPREMDEEVNRMREHLFKEVDKDKDGLISRQEFLDMTQANEFEHDNGWKGLDEQQIYTPEELQRFMEMRHQQAYYPGAHPNMQYHPGYGGPQGPHPGYPQQAGAPQMGYHPQGQQMGYMPQGSHQGGQPPMMGQQQMYQQQGSYGHPVPGIPQGGHQGMNPQMHMAPQMGSPQINSNPGQYHQAPQQPQGLPPPKVTAGQAAAAAAPSPQLHQTQQHFNQQPPPIQQQSGAAQHFNAQPNQQQFGQQQPQQPQAQFQAQQMPPQQKLQPPQQQPQQHQQQPQQQQQAQFKPPSPPIMNQASVRT